ncbi:pseudouridine synthase [candidate division LCP-89 bacterium B3_LCP]|uniref:Pseudouridine synthase n=1 Tax=candidate division LCP-89 bacterium B3_LCP TaxID=2012998 RepID=A0A532UXM8_UNCL8|nr:MAG: pseudouridine synthase [candidate division LCP-89 bacterium B3_LCP]
MVRSDDRSEQPDGEKIAKYLARCGVASRRKCEEYVKAGWVTVDSEIVLTPQTRIDSQISRVKVRGKFVSPPKILRYIIFNKPAGVLCTCNPGREKGEIILDLVKVPERVFPVGRLDKDTSGLLLLTNDGEFAQKLTHPSYQKEKEYLVETDEAIEEAHLVKLRSGVQLDDGTSKFKEIELRGSNEIKVILTEGKKRQIRRTLQTINLNVSKLHRVSVSGLILKNLKAGEWRDLTDDELKALKEELS